MFYHIIYFAITLTLFLLPQNHTTSNTRAVFRNVGDAAYAMSHAAVEACSAQWLAAGRGTDEYQLMASQLAAATYITAEHCTAVRCAGLAAKSLVIL